MMSFLSGLKKYQVETAPMESRMWWIASCTYRLDIYPAKKLAERYHAMLITRCMICGR